MSPIEALARWPVERGVVMLHSGRFHPRWGRWSILAEPGGLYQFVADGDADTQDGPRGRSRWLAPGSPGSPGTPGWSAPGSSNPGTAAPGSDASGPNWTPGALEHRPGRDLRTLLGGPGVWVGYLSYDLGRWFERIGQQAAADRDWPIVELAHAPGWLLHDGATGRWWACGTWAAGGFPDLPAAKATPTDAARYDVTDLRSVFDRPTYEAAVQRVKDYIAAGDVFQVNLAQRFSATFSGRGVASARALFGKLAKVSPAWYGAYLELGDGRVVASTSPELFLEVEADGTVITRPIKGTRPAAVPADELLHSEKDTAELNMIVDLLRNDLGRVCDYGSVRVVEPRTIESHPTVHHGVATIEGRLHRNKDVVDLLRASVPGGSITGAPKIRAMQIIEELEPVRRGPYCGCIGLLSRDYTCLNIAIRTMLLDLRRGVLDFSVGGGIVADSDPAAEYDETLDKAQAILQALGLRGFRGLPGMEPQMHTDGHRSRR